jgi:hypothetical protein
MLKTRKRIEDLGFYIYKIIPTIFNKILFLKEA